MSILAVAGGSNSATSASVNQVMNSTSKPGNVLIAYLFVSNAEQFTEAAGWISYGDLSTTGRASAIFSRVCQPGDSSTIAVCTLSTSAAWLIAGVEYTGVNTLTPVEAAANQLQVSSATYTTPTITPASGVERQIIACYGALTSVNFSNANITINGTTAGVGGQENQASASLAVEISDKNFTSTSGTYVGTNIPGATVAGVDAIFALVPSLPGLQAFQLSTTFIIDMARRS